MADTQELLLEKSISPEYSRFQNDELLEATLCKSFDDNTLTKREIEILDLVIAGHTNKEISQQINRTERTIEYHRNRVMHKLGAKTAADLVRRAITLGIA